MRFRIIRASDYLDSKEAPCDGAVPEVTKTALFTDIDWYLEITTLEELITLSNTVKESLIVRDGEIWIYDGYIE